jgi:hypothetical protein
MALFGTPPVLTASLGRLQSRLARDSRIGFSVEAEALKGQRGLRPAELSEAWRSYPKDDPSVAHLGDRQWSNRGSCRWHRRCRPLARAVSVLPKPGTGN